MCALEIAPCMGSMYGLAVWLSGNALASINVVALRQTRLVLGFRPPSATVVSAEPFSHGPGTLRCLQKEMATYRH